MLGSLSFLPHPKRLQRGLLPGYPLQWPLRNNQASEWILPCQPRKSCREAAARLCRIQSMLPAYEAAPLPIKKAVFLSPATDVEAWKVHEVFD